MSYAVEIKDVEKFFKIYNKPSDRLKELFSINKKQYYKKFNAIKNINLLIPRGKTIGIVGKNGSGKSTLLQIICGILKPSKGNVKVNGRISALLELGTGFNPEFTGRQNVYLYCSVMGLIKEDIDNRFKEIEDFAEIGEFIDQPVKTYSSGMYVRLAFSAAVNVDPDILIVDEALSVGDMYFQLKCIEKIKDFKNSGKTIIFVTHDTYTVKNICDYAVWIDDGRIELEGEVDLVIDKYEKYMKTSKSVKLEKIEDIEKHKVDDYEVLAVKSVEFNNYRNEKTQQFKLGESILCKVKYEVYKSFHNIVCGVAIFDGTGHYICGLNTKLDNKDIPNSIGQHEIILEYKEIQLLSGTYFIDVGFFEASAVARLDYKSKCGYFNIISERYLAEGNVLLKHEWSC